MKPFLSLAVLSLSLGLLACGAGAPAPLAEAPASSAGGARRGRAEPEIELTGNTVFDAAVLRRVAGSIECDQWHAVNAAIAAVLEGGVPNPCKSAGDIADEIKLFYVANGYLAADVRAAVSSKAKRVHIAVEEGALFRVGVVEVAEVDPLPADPAIDEPWQLAALLGLRDGEPFLNSRVQGAVERLKGWYVKAGYREAFVMPVTSITVDPPRIDLRFEIERGKKGVAAR